MKISKKDPGSLSLNAKFRYIKLAFYVFAIFPALRHIWVMYCSVVNSNWMMWEHVWLECQPRLDGIPLPFSTRVGGISRVDGRGM